MTDTDRSLIDITLDLGINHEVSKTSKSELEKSRGEFFDAATQTLETGILAKRTVEAPKALGGHRDLIETWAERWHPGWRVIATDDSEDNPAVQLEEDPSLKKFTFVNPDDGKVYTRNAIQGNPSLDDEQLKLDDPDLWVRISNPVPYPELDRLQEFCEFMDISYPDMMGWVQTKESGTDWPRVLIPIEEMSNEDFAQIEKYLVPAPISLRLESPRKAKPEDISDGQPV